MPKTLVLCFDGTTGQYSASNTNVVKFYSLLDKTDPNVQLCYYQPGVGTYFAPGVVAPAFQWSAKILDQAFAWYLYQHLCDGYAWLCDQYRPGDTVIMTGFSRGAYTARALAGLVHKIGLISPGERELIPFAYKLYTRTDEEGIALARGFQRAFGREIVIDFVGVWDTVVSVGLIAAYNLPFTASNEGIKVFRQAVALDEHRVRFMPNLYHRPAPDPAGAKGDPNHASSPLKLGLKRAFKSEATRPKTETQAREDPYASLPPEAIREAVGQAEGDCERLSSHLRAQSALAQSSSTRASLQESDTHPPSSAATPDEPDVVEVWFVGEHSDVGGGAVPDSTPAMLGNVPLRWMVRQFRASGLPISWRADALKDLGVDDPVECRRRDDIDCKAPVNDSLGLKGNWSWWILECFPLTYAYQDNNGRWKRGLRVNFGRGRRVFLKQPMFHETVKKRMEDQALRYIPKARWEKGSEVYVS